MRTRSIHFPPTVFFLSQSPSPSLHAALGSAHPSYGHSSKQIFPADGTHTPPLSTFTSDLMEIEMLFPCFPVKLVCLSNLPHVPSHPSSSFSSRSLLMRRPTNLLSVNRPPPTDRLRKPFCFFFLFPTPSSSDGNVSEDIMLSPTFLRGSVCEWLFLIRRRTASGMTAADR